MKEEIMTAEHEENMRYQLVEYLRSQELNLSEFEIGDLSDHITELCRQIINEG